MNDGLSFISSSVTITTVSCVSSSEAALEGFFPQLVWATNGRVKSRNLNNTIHMSGLHCISAALKSYSVYLKMKPKELCQFKASSWQTWSWFSSVWLDECVCVTVWWDHPGHSFAHPHAAPDSGSPLVVLAPLLHCGEELVFCPYFFSSPFSL